MGNQRGKRPWLAALLGTLATGLGHFYLRRWKRGLGWFLAAVVASFLFVPADAAQAFLAGDGDPMTLLPVIAVGVASVADAYVLARDRQRRQSAESEASTSTVSLGTGDGAPIPGVDAPSGGSDEGASCPNCGKELDPELDFCPWCTERLDGDENAD
ncbi:DUF6677 family protein [Halobellus ordinarius]|uniref:DUF6677 family protein n=1 Tax=Halobellus ordinarius TaxID=3075120 RepID=UPI0028802095|nr:DUF6677 family protein [Halobellus sp. ZY16]